MSVLAWTEPASARDRGRAGGAGVGGAGVLPPAAVADDRGRARSPLLVYAGAWLQNTPGVCGRNRVSVPVWGVGVWTQCPDVNTLIES